MRFPHHPLSLLLLVSMLSASITPFGVFWKIIPPLGVRGPYVCSPCGNDCDNEVYDKPGKCRHCGMDLVEQNRVAFKNISPDELCRIVNRNQNVVLLDVRTREEFNVQDRGRYGRLKNAINIPIQELERRMDELKAYKDREIIVYCSHSQRSPRASLLLTENGFTNVKNMSGGLSTWDRAVTDKDCRTGLLVK